MNGELGFVFLFFLGVPLVVGLGIWWQVKQTKANQAWAASVGWRYVGTDPGLADRWHGTPFGIGHSRRVSQLMVGPFRERPAMSFAYRYTTGSGKNQSTYTFHVISMALPAFLPNLQLTHEGVGARIAKAFGSQDIEFESDDFNRAWRVQAGVERFAHDVLHPRAMERLLRPDARGMSIRIEGTDVICWTSGGANVGVIGARLEVLTALVDAIPRYVWLDHGYDPGFGPDRAPEDVAQWPPTPDGTDRPPV